MTDENQSKPKKRILTDEERIRPMMCRHGQAMKLYIKPGCEGTWTIASKNNRDLLDHKMKYAYWNRFIPKDQWEEKRKRDAKKKEVSCVETIVSV